MTCLELSEDVKALLEKNLIPSNPIKVTHIFKEDDGFVMRAMINEENSIRVVQIKLKELCLYEGLRV